MEENRRKTSIDKEISEIEQNTENRKKIKKEHKKLKVFFIVCFILGTICCYVGLFLLYGPSNKFRDWLITSAMTTMNHRYFATWFFDDATIEYTLANNRVVESSTPTNPDLIQKVDYSTVEVTKFKNEYDKQVLDKNPSEEDYYDEKTNPDGYLVAMDEDYKIIRIIEDNYDGYLAAIYDPSRIHTITTAYVGSRGQYLKDMAKANNAIIAINGGGFHDPNFNSNGATPCGVTFSRGKIITSDSSWKGAGGLIGFNNDDKLILSKMCTASQAQNMGIRDAVTFGPFLIQDGVPNKVLGNGGWGQSQRTVIAQRQDGIVLFLVVDGRKLNEPGADMNDLIEIMQRYDAYNAANLDGGTSSVMILNNEMLNDPIDSTGAHKTRWISTGFILAPKE